MRFTPALLTIAALASPASAAAAWTPPINVVAPGQPVFHPQVEAAADGSAVLTFQRGDHAWAAVKQPGALFSAPQDLGAGTAPELAMAPSGRAIIAWRASGGFRTAVREASAPDVVIRAATTPISGLTQLAVAAGQSGRLYVASGAAGAVKLFTAAPGSTDPGSAVLTASATGPTGVSIATTTGADIAWVLVTDKASTYATTTLSRWSASIGASAQQILEINSDSGSQFNYKNTPVAMSGPRPSFFWERITAFGGIPGGSTSALMRVDDPVPPTPVPVQMDSGSSSASFTTYSRTAPSIVDDPSGTSALLWSSTSGTLSTGVSELFLSQRPVGGVPSPKLAVAGLTSPFVDRQVYAAAAAPAGAGATQVTYAVNGQSVATARLSAAGTLVGLEPTVLSTLPDTPPLEVAAAGTGSGDTVSFWNNYGAAGSEFAQIALDDATPPALTVAPAPQAARPPFTGTQAEADALNAAARTQTFEATATDLWTPTTLTWDFGDGATATGSAVTHTFAASGTITVKVTARDLTGNVTTQTIVRTIDTVAPPATPPAPPTTPSVKAVVTSAKLSAKRFSVAKSGKPSKTKGATITYALSAAAEVEISVLRPTKGYRSGKNCVAKKPKGKTAKRCTFDQRLGLAGTPTGVPGTNSFTFNGKVAGKFLKPGKYKLQVAAVADAQAHGTSPITIPFTIKR